MRVVQLVLCSAALTAICVASEPEKYVTWGDAGVIYPPSSLMQHGLWVTGDVINDPKQGLLFRADKPVEGNATGSLVYLAVPEDLSKTFAPMCYRAAERHIKLRLHGTFLPDSGPKGPNHPNVNFVIWGIHEPDEPDELPPDKKTYFGPHDAIPGYTIIPKKP
jgi:hypothetical protein